MGNSNTSTLPFEITGQIIEYDRTDWKFHTGQRKEDKERKEEVSIFRFPKIPGNNDLSLLVPAQRAVQKLRSLRHPFILSYLDSTEMDDAIMLVTEQSIPLSAWIKLQTANSVKNSSHLLSEIVWGMRCLLESLNFLHSNCNLTHGFIGLHAVFVCRTGDWKFGAFDLASNLNVFDDRAYYRPRALQLDDKFLSPERRTFARGTEGDGIDPAVLTKQGLADIYSLGMLLQSVMDSLGVVSSANAGKCLKKMQSLEYKKRPSAQQALAMVSDQLDLLSRLNELAIKPPADSVDILGHLAQHLDEVPISACHHKILPNIARVLSMSVNDFSKRDSREICRQVVQLAMSLLSALAVAGKLQSFVFNDTCLPVVAQLWGMSDRIVRTALLKNLEALAPFISESYVNKQIFDPLLNGFADTNAKMREETLKSLVHLTDKLDERNMQEKLVRCITGLQADSEASIRTNSVIFLGRIANRLKEGVRLRVLSVSFVKAMKDPFLHCRLAGLRASLACLNLLDGPQIAGKLLPQVCLLTLDRVAESRELALTALEQSTAQLRRLSEELKRAEAEQKRLGIESGAANKPAENEASWSIMGLSWGAAAVDGLAKTIEKTVLQNPTADDDVRPSSTSVKSSSSSHVQVASPKKTMSSTSGQSLIPPATTSITQKATSNIVRDTWDEDFDIPDEGDVDHSDGEDEPRSKGAGLKLDNNRKPVVRNGWDDFDDDFDDDKFDEKPAKQIIPMTQKTSSSDAVSPTSKAVCIEPDIVPCKVADNSPIAKTTGAIPTKGKGSSAKKPVVKLTKDKNESWDDF